MLRFLLCAGMALWSWSAAAETCPFARATYVDPTRPAATQTFVVERAERRRVLGGPAAVVLIGRLGERPAVAIAPFGDRSFYFAESDAPSTSTFMGDVTHETAPAGYFEPPIRVEAPLSEANFQLRCRPR
jgi:hypothetical protein